ncbi:MAG: hypothetical protein P0Y53_17330 [Candidatus Pseudobacter hemicellulosilyticus]|uniref:Uncharacterized protein n=1 Tax=Candidatus Pseudobacter hemicellulosilyticus TaxID=3121375 RepID=A0AAJ6BFG4_9BACT|nr:MAG: hypothetical protein P0Y53_17330 [Pseudobacter sp.]
MKFPDLTKLILDDSYWFIAGLFLFYLLSVVKVYILARIQANVLNAITSANKPFAGFFSSFFYSLLTEKNLHQLTFSFLIKYDKKNWPEIQNKLINNRLKLLTTITTFLKPFLAFALIFCVIRTWINTHFLYDPLQISLGEIQKKLSFIHSFSWAGPVIKYKATWLFILSAVTICFLSLKKGELFQRNLRKYYSYGFSLLSIILNVSFFTAGVAGSISREHLKLTSLEVSIVEIHNKIYTYAAETIATPLIERYFEEAQKFYDAEAKEFEKSASLSNVESYDSSLVIAYWQEIMHQLADYTLEYDIDVSTLTPFPPGDKIYLTDPLLPVPRQSSPDATYKTAADCGLEIDAGIETVQFPKGTRPPATAIDEYYDQRIFKTAPAPDYDAYIGNKEEWNMKRGTDILADIKVVRDKAVAGKEPASKKVQILGLLFSLTMELSLDKFFEMASLKSQKFLQKITSFFLETGNKDCFVKQTIKLISLASSGFKKKGAAIFCKQEILSEKEKAAVRLKWKLWLSHQKITLAKRHRELLAERKRKFEEEAQINKLHQHYARLEQEIIREIQLKPLGIPTGYASQISNYLNERMNSTAWIKAIAKMKANGIYKEDQPIEQNIESSLAGVQPITAILTKRQLQHYFIPAKPTGSMEKYGSLLRNNYTLISEYQSIASIAKAVFKRDKMEIKQFKSIFTEICWCCGLPLSFPVCGCSL